MTLNRATNLLQGLYDFIQLLRPQFKKFEGRGQVLSGCDHYTEEISRKKRRKVRLDSEDESEDTSLHPSSRLFLLVFFIYHIYPSLTRKRIASQYFGRDVLTRLGVGISEVSGPPVFHIKARTSR